MNISTTQMDLIVFLAGAALLYAFWVRAWQSYALDCLRQELFDLRDGFFDRVRGGDSTFRFEDAAYKKTREDLNRMIRFVRHFGLVQILLMSLFGRKYRKQKAARAEKFKQSLTPAQAQEIHEIDCAQGKFLVIYLIKTSPMLWFCMIFVAIGAVTIWAFSALSKNFISMSDAFSNFLFVPLIRSIESLAGQRFLVGRTLRLA